MLEWNGDNNGGKRLKIAKILRTSNGRSLWKNRNATMRPFSHFVSLPLSDLLSDGVESLGVRSGTRAAAAAAAAAVLKALRPALSLSLAPLLLLLSFFYAPPLRYRAFQ